MDDVRPSIQRVLVYFGLADERGAAREPSRGRDVFASLLAPPLFALIVFGDRGAGLAVAVLVLFVPAMARFALELRQARVHDRPDRIGDALFVPPTMFFGALMLFPDRLGTVWPTTAAVVASAVLLGGGVVIARRRKA